MKAFSRKTILIATLLIFHVIMLNAQSWQWAKHYGGVNGDAADNLCLDKNENVK